LGQLSDRFSKKLLNHEHHEGTAIPSLFFCAFSVAQRFFDDARKKFASPLMHSTRNGRHAV